MVHQSKVIHSMNHKKITIW